MKPSNPYKPALAALTLTLAALLLATCPNPAISAGDPAREPVPGSADVPAGTGLAVIQLADVDGGSAARTALPGIDGYLFILRFTDTDDDGDGNVKDPVQLPLRGAMSVTVPLEIGTWNLVVDAYTDSGQDLTFKATGSTTVPVAEGTTAAFTVELDLGIDFSGTGNFTYRIGIPASTRGWLGLYPLDVPEFSGAIFTGPDDNVLERDISNSGDIATGAANGIPGGTYRAVIDLYNEGANKFAVYSTIVHIYNGQSTPLNRTFTLEGNFADCPPKVTGTANTLTAKLDYALATEGDWTIDLDGTETDIAGNNPDSFVPKTLNVTAESKTITIRGNGHTVQLPGTRKNNSLFTLMGNLTLVLQDVTLQGHSGNESPLVLMNTGAALELRAGSLIIENKASSGGGVSVESGTFTMIGGTVGGNTSDSAISGGAVYVSGTTARFTMTGGAISGNTGTYHGGGVSVSNNGTFTMNGGAVSGNNIEAYSSAGGGVYVRTNGTFTMNGGAVSSNTVRSQYAYSGGVYVYTNGTFTMNGGTVWGNTVTATSAVSYAVSYGGGIYVNGGTFIMRGGTVSGNTAGCGKEVMVTGTGTFTMSDDARPERVLLYDTSRYITIGDLSGGTTMIDLGITSSIPLSDWEGKQILKPDGGQKARFDLGQTVLTVYPFDKTDIDKTPITGYTIGDDGTIQVGTP